MRRRALLLGLSAAACGPRALPPLPPAPAVRSAPELVPSDLDVVVRLDLGRMKEVLGAEALTALSRQVLSRAGGEQPVDGLVVASLLTAQVVYLGFRPSASWLPLDRVLALQGHFEPLRRSPQGFSGVTDVGADVRYWDNQTATPRDGVARIYALGDRGLVFVSEAEIDAVERVLDGLGSARRLEPPEQGSMSLALRPALLARMVGSGVLSDMLGDAKSLQLVVDLASDAVSLKGELALDSSEKALALAAAVQLVLSRLERVNKGATLRAEGERVLLSARFSRAEVAPTLACLQSGAADCAW